MDAYIQRAIKTRADELAPSMDDPELHGRTIDALTELVMTHHGGVNRDPDRGSLPHIEWTLSKATLESLHLRMPSAKYAGGGGAGACSHLAPGAAVPEDAAIEALNREVTTLRRQLLNAEASLEDVDEALKSYAHAMDNPFRRGPEQTTAECVLALVEKLHEEHSTRRVLEERNAQLQAELSSAREENQHLHSLCSTLSGVDKMHRAEGIQYRALTHGICPHCRSRSLEELESAGGSAFKCLDCQRVSYYFANAPRQEDQGQ